MRDFFTIVFLPTLAVCLLIFIIVILLDPLSAKTCKDKASIMGLNHNYGFWTGCMYEVDGRFVPEGMLLTIDLSER